MSSLTLTKVDDSDKQTIACEPKLGVNYRESEAAIAEPSIVSESILLRLAQGDQSASNDCIQAYGGLVWSIARKMLKGSADIEDVVQDIFIEVWRVASRFDPSKASEATFVTMIARRRLIDFVRKRLNRPEPVQLETDLSSSSSPIDAYDEREQYQNIRARMGSLREDERKVIELAILEGMSQSEIAKSLDMPLGSVKSNARRGIERLRKLMSDQTSQIAEDEDE